MHCMFSRRNYPAAAHDVAITITGSGERTSCYAVINGVKYTTAETIVITPRDSRVITFCVGVTNFGHTGWLKIDGETVVEISSSTTTYDYIIPDSVTAINIDLSYDRGGHITVITS